ncbi:uncharacterized protein B0H18DRAFT_1124098 [Fomitopsis serialis]|uniref:uncharacterized protein n=1 Tax=Fomitopsis serialis TaxID=139415 RepID=UPI002008BC8B|nr:uncharacterized protein B0H18DRAFT_1124098 [Neoantrodia serialis]KAH9916683.1 hypothetical protein B0H18DRAFT_1124098 [Neoantrodia serialis]
MSLARPRSQSEGTATPKPPITTSDAVRIRNDHLSESYRQALLDPEYATVRYSLLQPDIADEQRFLDAFGSTERIEHLAHHFPLALAAQAEPIQPAMLADLSIDGLAEMVASKRQSVTARSSELSTMQEQISEKCRQIELLHALSETHIHCLRLSHMQLQDVESYMRARKIEHIVEELVAEKLRAEQERKLRIMSAATLGFLDAQEGEDSSGSDPETDSEGSSVRTKTGNFEPLLPMKEKEPQFVSHTVQSTTPTLSLMTDKGQNTATAKGTNKPKAASKPKQSKNVRELRAAGLNPSHNAEDPQLRITSEQPLRPQEHRVNMTLEEHEDYVHSVHGYGGPNNMPMTAPPSQAGTGIANLLDPQAVHHGSSHVPPYQQSHRDLPPPSSQFDQQQHSAFDSHPSLPPLPTMMGSFTGPSQSQSTTIGGFAGPSPQSQSAMMGGFDGPPQSQSTTIAGGFAGPSPQFQSAMMGGFAGPSQYQSTMGGFTGPPQSQSTTRAGGFAGPLQSQSTTIASGFTGPSPQSQSAMMGGFAGPPQSQSTTRAGGFAGPLQSQSTTIASSFTGPSPQSQSTMIAGGFAGPSQSQSTMIGGLAGPSQPQSEPLQSQLANAYQYYSNTSGPSMQPMGLARFRPPRDFMDRLPTVQLSQPRVISTVQSSTTVLDQSRKRTRPTNPPKATQSGMTPHETDEWASRNTQFYTRCWHAHV